MCGEVFVVFLEVVVGIVGMIFEGRLGHLFESQPRVGVGFIGVVAVLVAHEGVVAEGFLLVGQDGEDGVHSISHVGQVFVDTVNHHHSQMLLRNELVEVLRPRRALEVFLEDLLDDSYFRVCFNHSNTVLI